MHRIIDGTLYTRHAQPYAHDIKVFDLGHGQTEAVVMPRYGWSETCALSELARLDYAQACADAADCLTEEEKLDKLARNKERATRRARSKVRRLAKSKGCDTMLTLTYRENMMDRDRMQRDFDALCKRIRRAFPQFEYVCVFEKQKRGAWHAHIACPKFAPFHMVGASRVPMHRVLRSMWRGVVGADNGNIDISRSRKLRSAAKLAAYLSKYIGKSLGENDRHVNSYSASGRALAPALSFRTYSSSLVDGIVDLYALLDADLPQREVFTLLCDGGAFFMCLSPPEEYWSCAH